MDRFLLTYIKEKTLMGKACFLKLKIDTPLSWKLSKIATSFLNQKDKLKNLFLLL